MLLKPSEIDFAHFLNVGKCLIKLSALCFLSHGTSVGSRLPVHTAHSFIMSDSYLLTRSIFQEDLSITVTVEGRRETET